MDSVEFATMLLRPPTVRQGLLAYQSRRNWQVLWSRDAGGIAAEDSAPVHRKILGSSFAYESTSCDLCDGTTATPLVLWRVVHCDEHGQVEAMVTGPDDCHGLHGIIRTPATVTIVDGKPMLDWRCGESNPR